jgi:hypothetical protein
MATGAVLMAAMLRRDNPMRGIAGLTVLITAGIPATAYGVLASF